MAELTVPKSADRLRDAQQPNLLNFTNYSEPSSQPGPSLTVDSELDECQLQSQPKSRQILIIGDSLLHRIKSNKLKVGNIPSVKLNKKGDRLNGTTGRCRNFLRKNADEHIDLVLLAGTNELASRHVSPEELIKKLDKSINELTKFHNLHYIILCQLPPGFDFRNIIPNLYKTLAPASYKQRKESWPARSTPHNARNVNNAGRFNQQ